MSSKISINNNNNNSISRTKVTISLQILLPDIKSKILLPFLPFRKLSPANERVITIEP